MSQKPLKRHKALQNLSREHHNMLVFALRLQKGVTKKALIEEMLEYIEWFWTTYIKEHLQLEEEGLFPLFGLNQELVKKAMHDHKEIKQLVHLEPKSYGSITAFYKKLQTHIRFEERELFMLIQKELSVKDLKTFEKLHTKESDCGLWTNTFWE